MRAATAKRTNGVCCRRQSTLQFSDRQPSREDAAQEGVFNEGFLLYILRPFARKRLPGRTRRTPRSTRIEVCCCQRLQLRRGGTGFGLLFVAAAVLTTPLTHGRFFSISHVLSASGRYHLDRWGCFLVLLTLGIMQCAFSGSTRTIPWIRCSSRERSFYSSPFDEERTICTSCFRTERQLVAQGIHIRRQERAALLKAMATSLEDSPIINPDSAKCLSKHCSRKGGRRRCICVSKPTENGFTQNKFPNEPSRSCQLHCRM